jgi:hypothetical protein
MNVFLAKAVLQAGFQGPGIHLPGLRGTFQNTMAQENAWRAAPLSVEGLGALTAQNACGKNVYDLSRSVDQYFSRTECHKLCNQLIAMCL